MYLIIEDEFSCDFLLKHGALPTAVLPDSGYSPLHLLADWKSDTVADVSSLLLKQGCSPNAVAEDGRYNIVTAQRDHKFGPRDHNSLPVSFIDCFCYASSSTPLHLAVRSNNLALIEILLADSRTDCERQDKEGFVPLWYALQNPVSQIIYRNVKKSTCLVHWLCFRLNCPLQSS